MSEADADEGSSIKDAMQRYFATDKDSKVETAASVEEGQTGTTPEERTPNGGSNGAVDGGGS